MTSLRLAVSKKLPHAVQSYKARAEGGSKELASKRGAEVANRAGAKEPQLGANLGAQNLGAEPPFFGPQKNRLPTLAKI